MVRGQMGVVNVAVWLSEVRGLVRRRHRGVPSVDTCVEATINPGESVVTTAGWAQEKG